MDKKIYTKKQAKIFAKEFVDFLKEQSGLKIKTAFLFGSHAKGNAHKDSDIDVAIVTEKFNCDSPLYYLCSKRRKIDVERGIESHFFTKKDFANVNDPLAYEIHKTGIKVI